MSGHPGAARPKYPFGAIRRTHAALRGPRVCQPTRLPLHRQLPLLRLPLQRWRAHRSLRLPMQRRAVPTCGPAGLGNERSGPQSAADRMAVQMMMARFTASASPVVDPRTIGCHVANRPPPSGTTTTPTFAPPWAPPLLPWTANDDDAIIGPPWAPPPLSAPPAAASATSAAASAGSAAASAATDADADATDGIATAMTGAETTVKTPPRAHRLPPPTPSAPRRRPAAADAEGAPPAVRKRPAAALRRPAGAR